MAQLSTAVIVCDCARTITYVNPAAEQLMSLSARQACGARLDRVIGLPETLWANLNTCAGGVTERAATMIDALGCGRAVDISAVRIEVEGLTQFLLEISTLERHLKIVKEEALVAQQATSKSLLGGLAHEIKNPLGGLRGAAQLLAAELGVGHVLHEYTDVIISETDRLTAVVDRMLGPRTMMRWQSVNIHQVCDRLYQLLRAESAHLQIIRDYDPSIPELPADPDLLLQVLLNLGRNAQAALNESGVGAQIILRTRVLARFTIAGQAHRLVACVQICDDGPGIGDELIERIFFPLVSGRAEGSGLGLSIAQTLIARHAGLIECESRPGNTVFSVYLPLERTDADDMGS